MTLKYSYKTEPYSHQKRALAKLYRLNGIGALFMEMGTGKTKVAIDWAGIGYYNFGVRRVLVISPLSVLPVWPRQIREHSAIKKVRVFSLMGKTEKRVAFLKVIIERKNIRAKRGFLDFIIINYEGIWRETDHDSVKDLLKEWEPDIVICDESHRIKSPTAKQSKAAAEIGRVAKQRLILTGTAVTKSPLDLWAQFRFLNPDIFISNWFHFKNKYGVWGGFGRYQLLGYKNLPDLITKVRENSFRVKKEHCLDLPPKQYLDVPVTLSDRGMKLYRDMARQMIIEIEENEYATAAIVLVKLLRLSQITSGFIKTTEGKLKVFDGSKLRSTIDLLKDVIEEDHKVVVFCRFLLDIERLSAGITEHGLGRYVILSGRVPGHLRDGLVRQFHEDPATKIFIAQIQSGSLGIDLTPADVAIFFSLDYNYANYIQAVDRLHRIGQTRSVSYYHMVVPHTIDTVVLSILKEKGNIAEAVIHDPKILLP